MPRTVTYVSDDPRSPETCPPEHPRRADGKLEVYVYYHTEHYMGAFNFSKDLQTVRWGADRRAGYLTHIAFICPTCGEIWQRRFVEQHPKFDFSPIEWRVLIRTCPKHGPSSIMYYGDMDFDLFPVDVLAHELICAPRSLPTGDTYVPNYY